METTTMCTDLKEKYILDFDSERTLRDILLDCRPAIASGKTRILNVACEYKLVPDFLDDIIQEENAYGLEINENIVDKNSHIRLCDVNHDKFPFSDDFFDIVLSVWGMEHFESANIFSEASRVLSSGGVFVFIAPNPWHPIFLVNRVFGEKLAHLYYKRIIKSWYVPHKAYYRFNRSSAVRAAIQGTDLRLESVAYIGPSNILGYFSFSRTVQSMVIFMERLLTNPILYRFKPAIICVLRKS